MTKVEKERKICEKCGGSYFCDDHHILPKTIFGKGETRPLCKTCHDEYHRFLGFKFLRKNNAQPREFYITNWLKWISILIFLGILISIFI